MSKKQFEVKEQIIKKINEGNVSMKPKYYFIFGSILMAVGIGSTLFFGVLSTNIFFFKLRRLQMLSQHGFFKPGLAFAPHFPWVPLFLSIGLLILGIYLFKKFDVSYKLNLAALIGIVIASLFITGFLLDRSNFNERIGTRPRFRPIYERIEGRGFCRQNPDYCLKNTSPKPFNPKMKQNFR